MKEPNKFHNYETEKITCKASDMAEYVELFGSSTRDRHARRITVILWTFADNASSCTTISGGRTEQHVVIRFRELAAVD